ncbi:MAG TPA: helix-turn-helix domain-containing protein [Mycobacteriales bacterium]|nr:helix-turn-helix domain-containing protein [Mycobacteriales bacterium]
MDVGEVLTAQTEMYGEPLGQRFGRLLAAYRISQARLASVLGLSPPMLSQLMSGQRAKISNPAVFGRLVRLEELAAGVTSERARDAALDEVRESRPTLHTGQLAQTAGPDRTDGARVLAGLVPPDVLTRAAGEVTDPGLAALLRAAAALRGTFRTEPVA